MSALDDSLLALLLGIEARRRTAEASARALSSSESTNIATGIVDAHAESASLHLPAIESGDAGSVLTVVDGGPEWSSPPATGITVRESDGSPSVSAATVVEFAGATVSDQGSGVARVTVSGISDGDKGDIAVSSSGTVWTIDAGAVSYAKIQDVSAASRLLGRGSAGGAGDVEEITLGTGLSMSGTTLNAVNGASYVTTVGDGSNTTYTVTHNLGTRDVVVEAWETASPYQQVFPTIKAATTSTVTVQFASAPTTNQYRVLVCLPGGNATAVSTGTTPVVIPGLAGSADRAGAGIFPGVSLIKEFDDTSHGLTWSSAPAAYDSNTTIPSCFYARSTDNTDGRTATCAWAPSGDFDVRAHLGAWTETAASAEGGMGLYLANSDDSVRCLVHLIGKSSVQIYYVVAFTFNSGSWTQRVAWGGRSQEVYARISRSGSTWSLWFSDRGREWQLLWSGTLSLTVAKLGYRLTAYSAGVAPYGGYSDWLRAIG